MAQAQHADRVIYRPRGPAAIDPRALGQELDARAPAPIVVNGTTAVVDVRGPLVNGFSYGLQSYQSIVEQVKDACRTPEMASIPVSDVVLYIDSPGGDVYNCFETARAIQAICKAAGKRLHAYVCGSGTSAAYALACAADGVYASDVACVGSIGVIDLMVSAARQDAQMGIDVATVTSGERKADGNPHVPLSEAAVAAHQQHVNDLAAVFFAWVSERRGIPLETVAALQAAVFVGARAKDAGLVDTIADFRSLQEILASGTIDATARNVPQGTAPQGIQAMATPQASKYVDAMAALAAAAEEGDERARSAMKKMAASEKPADGDGDKDKPAEDKKDAKAEGDKEEPKAAAASTDVALLAAAVARIEANDRARAEASERAQLLASRPDLTADATTKAQLETASLETVKAIIKMMPKAELTAPAKVTPTRGATAGQGTATGGLEEQESQALKERMGLAASPVAKVHKIGDADVIVFGATDAQAAKIAAERGF